MGIINFLTHVKDTNVAKQQDIKVHK